MQPIDTCVMEQAGHCRGADQEEGLCLIAQSN